MERFAVAIKAFVVSKGKVLLLKRNPGNVHKPNEWDIPGGRLNPGEDPYKGLARETHEETGLSIYVLTPIGVEHFARDDGQMITMIIFLCEPKGTSVSLSDEHVEYKWVKLRDVPKTAEWLTPCVESLMTYYKQSLIR